MQVKMRCLGDFFDGNIFPNGFKTGDVIVVTERQAQQLMASGHDHWEEVEKLIPPPTKAPPKADPSVVKATPGARKVAKDLGVDLSSVSGTGKNGYITASDVEDAA